MNKIKIELSEAHFEIEEAAQVRKHWEQMPGIGWEDSTGRMRAPSVSWVEMETEEYEFWRKDYYRCLGYRASVDGGVVFGDAWRASVWPQEGSEGE